MSSLSSTDLVGVFTDTGLSVLADLYTPDALWFDGLFDQGDVSTISDPEFGDKSSTLVFGTGLDEYDLGVEAKLTSAVRGYTPQGKLRRFQKAMTIPLEALGANNGVNRSVKLVAEFVRQQQVNYTNSLNARIANIFLKGAYTAGAPDTFQASYQDNAASFDGFCYDGQPLFSDAHPLKAPNGSTTTFDNYMASQALDATTFEAAYIRQSVTNAISETGDSITITPKVMLGGPSLRQAMFGITNTQNVPGTANFQENVNRGVVEHRVVKQFGTSAAWFLIADPMALRIRLSNNGQLRLRSWIDEDSNSMKVEVKAADLAYPRDARFLLAANSAQS